MSSTTRSPPRRHACIVWVTLLSVTSTFSVDHDSHWKRENATILMMTVKLRARSTLQCTLKCFHSSPCGSFCMRRSDNSCYLAVEKPSPLHVLGEFLDVRCFTKGQTFSFMVYTHTHTLTHTHTHTHTHTRAWVCTYVCMYFCMCVCVCVCVWERERESFAIFDMEYNV